MTTAAPATQPLGPSRGTARIVLLWVARAGIALWAAFWLWFNIASMIGEADGQIHHLQVAAITLGVAAAAWRWPRAGGTLMVIAGVLAAWAFPNRGAITLLAIPAMVVGLLSLLSGPWGSPR